MIFSRLAEGEVNRAEQVFYRASGKSINVARGLHTLGEEAALITPLGGKTGEIVLADLKNSTIPHRIVITRAQTRTCITAVDRSRREATELVEEAEKLRPAEIAQLKKTFLQSLRGASMAILSGSLAAGVSKDFYADCCAAANARNVKVILDARGPECSEPCLIGRWSSNPTDWNLARHSEKQCKIAPYCAVR